MSKDDQIMAIGLGILGYKKMSDSIKTGEIYTPVLKNEVIEKYQSDVLFHNIIDIMIDVLT